MSYPPPPGLKNSAPTSSSPHPSLPARPPPSTTSSSFQPASSATASDYRHDASHGASYVGGWNSHSPASAVGPSRPPAGAYGYPQQYMAPAATAAGTAVPQIINPFPLPGQGAQGGNQYDADEAAQIAQWQSAYNAPDASATTKPATGAQTTSVRAADGANATKQIQVNGAGDATAAAVAAAAAAKQKTVLRTGGGKTWQDDTLLEWDPAHFRLQIGNLAGEVTDESLLKAFSHYASVQKARVIRDKRTTKSKGYGFVSFSEGDDYFNAFREMKNKYIGSHPVTIQPCKTKIQTVDVSDKNKNNRNNRNNKGGKHASSASSATNTGHANTGAGVQKKPSKTKSGLRILG